MSQAITPFDPSIPQPEIDRLFRKLSDTRLPTHPVVPDTGSDYGPPLDWVQKLYSYWLNTYSWSTARSRISSWHHYTTTLEGMKIHFVHEPARKNVDKAIPLLMVHGWPGSWYEFNRLISPLTNPESSGDGDGDGDGEQSFHLVIPSIPGFTWSDGPLIRGWSLQDSARIFDTLMQRLGYESYVAQGGDWGHWVVRELGANPRYRERCRAVHTNMCPSQPPVPQSEWTEREKTAKGMSDWWLGKQGEEWHMGYAIEMRTRPQTIGVALADNPVGVMVWVGEKYLELVDPKYRTLDYEGDDRVRELVDDLCTTLCLYHFTSPSIMTSALCYTFNVIHERYVGFNTREENLIKVPFGFSSFRWDISPVSQRAAATTGDCKWFREYDHGGHFAALECPEEVVADLRDCFKEIYKA